MPRLHHRNQTNDHLQPKNFCPLRPKPVFKNKVGQKQPKVRAGCVGDFGRGEMYCCFLRSYPTQKHVFLNTGKVIHHEHVFHLDGP